MDFGLQNGFAHVIEDDQMFPEYFGREIVGGMLDVDHRLWRKQAVQLFADQQQRAEKLKAKWAPYDWTAKVKEAIQNQNQLNQKEESESDD